VLPDANKAVVMVAGFAVSRGGNAILRGTTVRPFQLL
jgi:hypothetical protein